MRKCSLFGLLFFLVCFVGCFIGSAKGDMPITIGWNASTSSAVTGYKVYLGDSSRNYGAPLDAGALLRYTIASIARGAKKYIAVTAYSSDAESALSEELTTVLLEDGTDTAGWIASKGTPPYLDFSSLLARYILVYGGPASISKIAYLGGIDPANKKFSLKFRAAATAPLGYFLINISTTNVSTVNMMYKFTTTDSYGTNPPTSTNLTFGIDSVGSTLADTQWHVLSRDLLADLQKAQSGNTIRGINSLAIYSYGVSNTINCSYATFYSN